MKPHLANSRLWSAGAFLLVLAVGGCGGNSEQNTVTGYVKYGEKPLTSGTVIFQFTDGTKKGTPIGADGHYRMTEIGAGPVRIGVFSKGRVPPGLLGTAGPGGNTAGPQEAVVEIPVAYNSPEASGLTYEVGKGTQKHDIELTPKPSGR